jgi:hypothetical protein
MHAVRNSIIASCLTATASREGSARGVVVSFYFFKNEAIRCVPYAKPLPDGMAQVGAFVRGGISSENKDPRKDAYRGTAGAAIPSTASRPSFSCPRVRSGCASTFS